MVTHGTVDPCASVVAACWLRGGSSLHLSAKRASKAQDEKSEQAKAREE